MTYYLTYVIVFNNGILCISYKERTMKKMKLDLLTQLSDLRAELRTAPEKKGLFYFIRKHLPIAKTEQTAYSTYTKITNGIIRAAAKHEDQSACEQLITLKNCFEHYADSSLHQKASRSLFGNLFGQETHRAAAFQHYAEKVSENVRTTLPELP